MSVYSRSAWLPLSPCFCFFTCYGLDVCPLQGFLSWKLGPQYVGVRGSGTFKKWELDRGPQVMGALPLDRTNVMAWGSPLYPSVLPGNVVSPSSRQSCNCEAIQNEVLTRTKLILASCPWTPRTRSQINLWKNKAPSLRYCITVQIHGLMYSFP